MRYAISVNGVHLGARFETMQQATDAVDREDVYAGRTVLIHDSEAVHPDQFNAWFVCDCTPFAMVLEGCHAHL